MINPTKQPDEYEYRLATLADRAIVMKALADLIGEQPRTLTDPHNDLTDYNKLFTAYCNGTRRGQTAMAIKDSKVYAVALVGETLVKSIEFNRVGDVAIVWGVWVEKSARDQGLAGRIAWWGREFLRSWGFTHMMTRVLTGNDVSHQLALSQKAKPYEIRYLFTLDPEGW